MDSSILRHLHVERDLLRRKLAAVEAMIELYGDVFPTEALTEPDDEPASAADPISFPPKRPPLRQPTEYTMSVRRLARELIESNGGRPVPTRDVIAAIKREGMEVRGQNELTSVSATLSRSLEFANVEKAGWVLANG